VAQEAEDCSYRYDTTKSKKGPAIASKTISVTANGQKKSLERALKQGMAIGKAMNHAKQLGNLPGNNCTQTFRAKEATQLGKPFAPVTTSSLSEKQMQRLGMGSLLSVSAGSAQEAKLIVMHYKGAAASSKPHALVGKGVTFDTGGITLKPGPAMDEMKFDMCGAAGVIGTMAEIASMKLPINVNVVVPAVENMPGSVATKPGDIVKSMSGQTIEVLNTDAEGRLILCDALTYSRRFKPAAIIDVATLTGACVVALGAHRSAIMSHSDTLRGEIFAAGEAAEDRGWPMPLGDEYAAQLKSNFADMANIGGAGGGAVTAGCFLGKFTDGMNWAHLDIAGVAWKSGAKKGASGRPVPMLSQLLLERRGRPALTRKPMARGDVYGLAQVDERARHVRAGKRAEKAWRLDNTVYIHAGSRADAEQLDKLLWTFRDGSFVPHGLAGRNDGTESSPIMIGPEDDGVDPRDFLI